MVRHVAPREDQMAHPNADLVREGVAAFQRGDLDALQRLYFAEDIGYHVPGRSPVAGDYKGTAQVLAFFGRLFELSGGTLQVELHDVVANDQHAVALLVIRAERAGKQLQDNTVLTCHIRDGKITEIWSHDTDLYAVDEFWS
jgi:ketosteroid isomerase-like protein